MIKYLALLHRLSEGHKPINTKYREQRTKAFCLAAAKIEAKRFKDVNKGKQRLERIESQLRVIQLPKTLPKGIAHGDFDANNIKFMGNKLAGVLDFDDATYTFLLYDVGVILLYWARFYGKRFDYVKARDIIKIYERYRPLSAVEKQHLFDAVRFSAIVIMSFLLYDKWKGKDLFAILSGILDEMDEVGRADFYKKIFR